MFTLPQNGVEARRRPGGEIPEVSLCGPADSHVVEAVETACDASAQPLGPPRSFTAWMPRAHASPPGFVSGASMAQPPWNRSASVLLQSDLMFSFVSDAVTRFGVDAATRKRYVAALSRIRVALGGA